MLTDFGDRPLVVLTAGAETDATNDAAQNKLTTLSTNSSHRVIEGASHPALILTSGMPRPPPKPYSTSCHRSERTDHWTSEHRGKGVPTPGPAPSAHALDGHLDGADPDIGDVGYYTGSVAASISHRT
jgi:hypothetical protein